MDLMRDFQCSGFHTPAYAEKDPDFRREILRLTVLGMRLASGLAILAPILGIGFEFVFSHSSLSFASYGPGVIALWDEMFAVILGTIGLVISGRPIGARYGRIIVATFLFLMFEASAIDSIIEFGFAGAHHGTMFTMLMLVAVGAMPYRALQAAALALAMTAGFFATVILMPQGGLAMAQAAAPMVLNLVIIVTLFSGGVAALLYGGRWRQYQSHHRMAESEREYRSLFENSTDAIFVIDNATGMFTQVNASLEQLVGAPAGELCQTAFIEVIHPSDRERVAGIHAARLRGESAPIRYTLKVLSRNSSEPVICDLTVHRTVGSSYTRGAVRDITDQIRSEEKIRTYAGELETTNQHLRDTQSQLVQSEKMAALGTLVAGIAHEINTPIGSIHANADTSRRALEIIKDALSKQTEAIPAAEKVHRAIHILDESNTTTCTATDRIVRIVRSLRNFARLDEAELKKVDLHEGIESTLILVHHEYKNRIEIVREYGDLPKIECYPNQLNQVFMNLLVNAIHAIEDTGTITISTSVGNGDAIVRVTDTGRGIAEQNLSRIFDPGFTTKGVGVGTGLGLSIVYKIVQAHDGAIDVESKVGVGTTFTLRLPLAGPNASTSSG